MTKGLRIGILGLVVLGLTSCAPSMSTISKNSGAPAIPTIQVTNSFNGSVIHTAIGHLLNVSLDGQGWTFDATPARLVKVEIRPTSSIPANCLGPRQTAKCGQSSISYRAAGAGTIALRATRSMCGEARRCLGTEGKFSVTVIVGRGVIQR